MTKYYLLTIAILTAYIGLTLPYTTESVRNHVAIRVSEWKETKEIYRKKDSVDINVATFQAVRLPELPEIK